MECLVEWYLILLSQGSHVSPHGPLPFEHTKKLYDYIIWEYMLTQNYVNVDRRICYIAKESWIWEKVVLDLSIG